MPKKVQRKAKKKQRRLRNILPWIDKIATAGFWIVKTVLLIIEWWLAH